MAGLTVTMQEQTVYVANSTQAFRIKATAAANGSVSPLPDAKIFLYSREPAESEGGVVVDRFIAVCSPLDMETYPADTPSSTTAPFFFRLNQIDLVHPSRDILLEVWGAIRADIQNLSATIEAMNDLATGEVLSVGW